MPGMEQHYTIYIDQDVCMATQLSQSAALLYDQHDLRACIDHELTIIVDNCAPPSLACCQNGPAALRSRSGTGNIASDAQKP